MLLSAKTKGVLGAHYRIPGTFSTSEIQEKVSWLLKGGVFKLGGVDVSVCIFKFTLLFQSFDFFFTDAGI